MSTVTGTARVGGETLTATTTLTLPEPVAGHRVLYGCNPGGWAGLESSEQAFRRMAAAFGTPGIMRLWPNDFRTTWAGGLVPSYVWASGCGVYVNLGSDVDGVNAGRYDRAIDQLALAAPRDRYVAVSVAHEPENDTTPGPWAQANNRVNGRIAATGRTDIGRFPLLMGATYHPTRYKWTNSLPWTAWWENIDLSVVSGVGADCYQSGKNLAELDHAATVFNPVYDALHQLGLPQAGFGEIGAMRQYPGTTTLVPDKKRNEYLRELITIIEAHAEETAFAAAFESAAGAKGPWNFLPKPGAAAEFPLCVATWREAITS